MSVRGITAQELPQNQDPSVRFMIDEVTKVVTPVDPPKRRGPKRVVKEVEDVQPPEPEPAPEGDGE
jgi:hypothetical protein